MRLFIAFDVSEEAGKHLLELQKKLKGKLSLTKSFHLTLKFLGEITPAKAEEVKKRLAEIKFKPFTAELDGTGVFPERGEPRVIWIGINPEETIKTLKAQIDEALHGLFPTDKDFKAHLTIARVKEADKQSVEHAKKLKVEPIKFEVKEFKLIESKLTPKGSVYKDLAVYK